jgi:hypothetical protein
MECLATFVLKCKKIIDLFFKVVAAKRDVLSQDTRD